LLFLLMDAGTKLADLEPVRQAQEQTTDVPFG
jgi:hypothetical protein